MLGVSLHFAKITLHFPNLQGGDRFDLDCVRHHAVQLSGTLWRRATLVRYWAGFFLSPGGLSVPVGVLGRFEAAVSARKNPVPGGLPSLWQRREGKNGRFGFLSRTSTGTQPLMIARSAQAVHTEVTIRPVHRVS
jgi:hypothetical protein